ncbi:MAG TPA: molybdopterin-dependent oxidoreductase [Anaerolineales bacterium]|nr:molybdopterin-dependent oxidoreductase [Anaerolineales bacterium]
MKKAIGYGVLFGVMLAFAAASIALLGERLAGLPLVPFRLFDGMARILPGAAITLGIDAIVAVIRALRLGPTDTTAKLAEQTLAVIQFLGLGALLGGLLAVVGRRDAGGLRKAGYLAGAALFILMMLVEAFLGFLAVGPILTTAWLAALSFGWGAALAWVLRRALAGAGQPEGKAVSRRAFLYLVGGGLLTVSVGSIGLASWLRKEPESALVDSGEEVLDIADTSGPAASPSQEILAARSEAAPGTRPELTTNKDFYRIDINTRPPQVDGGPWRLKLEGLVRTPLSLTLDELRAMPTVSQVVTMQCISNPIGGDLTSTSRWTGVRFKDVLDRAGLLREAQAITIKSADGFYETVRMEDAMDERTLLVFAMNGVPLPVEHGFPLRIYIPNRYGMKQPKWIESMEVVDQWLPGYWVSRGWSEEALVNATSVVDAVFYVNTTTVVDGEAAQAAQDGTVPVGGIAWAGSRGISRVEVQVDDGPWIEAVLRTPPLSPLTWVQWRYDWQRQAGRHTFRVRAYDGAGLLQATTSRPVRPDGATGVHELTVNL